MIGPERIYLSFGFAQGLFISGWALAAVPWWVVELDLSPLRLVLLGVALQGAIVVAEVPTGVVADVFSRKWSIVISWIMVGAAQVLAPVTEVFAALILWQVLWAIGFTFQSGADTAWVTDETGTDVDQLIVRQSIARSVGGIVGVIGSIGLVQWSVTGSMQVFGAATIAYGAVLILVMDERNFVRTPAAERDSWGEMHHVATTGWRLTRSTLALWVLAVSMVLLSSADAAIDRLDIRRLVEMGVPSGDAADTATWFGWVWVLMIVLNIPPQLLAQRWIAELSSIGIARVMRLILFVSALAILPLALGRWLVVAIIGWIVRDVIREVIEPVAAAWTNRHATSDVRATALSFQSQAAAIGETFGGLALGVVAELISLAAAFGAAVALSALAGLQFLVVERAPSGAESASH